MGKFQPTSATFITFVSLLGILGSALSQSANTTLVLAGTALAGLYSVCHAYLTTKAPVAPPVSDPWINFPIPEGAHLTGPPLSIVSQMPPQAEHP